LSVIVTNFAFKETNMQVKMMGNDMMLEGQIPKLGEVMPSAKLLDNELKEVSTDSFRGKVLLIATVPSLDTPVCDAEAHRFNKEAASLGSDIQILVVSMDCPLRRHAGAEPPELIRSKHFPTTDMRISAKSLAFLFRRCGCWLEPFLSPTVMDG